MADNLERILTEFTEQVKQTYGETLLAVILYGSAASDEFVEGRSNINCLVLLKQVSPDELKKSTPLLQSWREQGMRTPLFVDPAYVRAAVDVFPIEFLDMKQRYKVLHGHDFLREIELKLDHLRFQCEQELKGKMLRLRQLYLEASLSESRLMTLLAKSTSSFMILFRGLLYLKGMVTAQTAQELFADLTSLGLPNEAFARVYALRRNPPAPSQVNLDALFRQYLSEIEAVVRFVETIRP